jgi:hypothetical protein
MFEVRRQMVELIEIILLMKPIYQEDLVGVAFFLAKGIASQPSEQLFLWVFSRLRPFRTYFCRYLLGEH